MFLNYNSPHTQLYFIKCLESVILGETSIADCLLLILMNLQDHDIVCVYAYVCMW